jgi:hypothetical protein
MNITQLMRYSHVSKCVCKYAVFVHIYVHDLHHIANKFPWSSVVALHRGFVNDAYLLECH